MKVQRPLPPVYWLLGMIAIAAFHFFLVSRHPMYVGFLAVLGGAAILAGTTAPILIFGLMIWLIATHLMIPEEGHMEEQFGDA